MISIHPNRLKSPELLAEGLQLQRAGRLMEAREVYHKILDKHPHHAAAKFLLALCYEAGNEQVHAFNLLDEVVRTKPHFPEAWYNRGVVLQWLGRVNEARMSYERAIRQQPNFAAAYTNLGNALMSLGDEAGAIRAFDRASELNPDTTEGTHNRSFVYLLRGDWERGWRDYETRWGLPGMRCPIPAGQAWWQGEPLAGKSIAVAHEQGFGDTFMTLRYVPLLQAMGARVVCCVPPELVGIIEASFPGVETRSDGSWPDVDYALPFLSLPSRFDTRPDTVPLAEGYLRAPEMPKVLSPTEGFPVAFAWRGSSEHKNDRNRSTRLLDWLPLFGIPGITWYCLQRDVTDLEGAELSKVPGMHFVLSEGWGDTASVLAEVRDLGGALVSVDTGIAHLAGALGLPAAVLISALPDFRWLQHRSDTVWYDQMRVYRQPLMGDWRTPMLEIAGRLKAIVERKEAA